MIKPVAYIIRTLVLLISKILGSDHLIEKSESADPANAKSSWSESDDSGYNLAFIVIIICIIILAIVLALLHTRMIIVQNIVEQFL